MIYILCGSIIGIVMGFTGAGGALVAIPLFMQFLGMSLKEASVYSLVAVVVASFSNFVIQREFTNYKLASLVVLFSSVGSYFTAPIKKMIPNYAIAGLLTAVSLYALWYMWFGLKPVHEHPKDQSVHLGLSVPIGIALGVLTTITGLGGGVLMMPVFLKFYSFSENQAVATSLLAVALSSLVSLLIQVADGFQMPINLNLFLLLSGILVSALLLKKFVKQLSLKKISQIRKIVFSAVAIMAILKIF